MENAMIVHEDNLPAISDDSLLMVAEQAEKRIKAVIKIKELSLMVTNSRDWNNQGGNPYLQVSGSEKIANLFNISWAFLTPEPLLEHEEDGHYTYTFQGRFLMGSRSIEVEGSRSSKDSFFKQNLYEDGKFIREKTVEERDNKRDVKMAALTNMLGNGITRLLGIRNLTWEDLEKYASIKKDAVGKIDYKTKGKDQSSLKKPAKKAEKSKDDGQGVQTLVLDISSTISEKTGKPRYHIEGEEDVIYHTFSATDADLAATAMKENLSVNIVFEPGKYGNNISELSIVEVAE